MDGKVNIIEIPIKKYELQYVKLHKPLQGSLLNNQYNGT